MCAAMQSLMIENMSMFAKADEKTFVAGIEKLVMDDEWSLDEIFDRPAQIKILQDIHSLLQQWLLLPLSFPYFCLYSQIGD